MLRIRNRIRIRRIRMFLGLLDPDPDPLVQGSDPDPSIKSIKNSKKNLNPSVLWLLYDFYLSDPDPYQNVTDPQHWFQVYTFSNNKYTNSREKCDNPHEIATSNQNKIAHFQETKKTLWKLQCLGSVTFWCGSGSPSPYFKLMDPDPWPRTSN